MFFHKYERIDATVFHGDLQAKDFFENAISMHEIKHAEVMYNVAYHDMTSRKNIKPFPKPKVRWHNFQKTLFLILCFLSIIFLIF